MATPDAFTGPVHENNLEMLDMNDTCLRLGIKVKGRSCDWLMLDLEDWKILHALLTRRLVDDASAAEHSIGLQLLDDWARASIKFMESEVATSTIKLNGGKK